MIATAGHTVLIRRAFHGGGLRRNGRWRASASGLRASMQHKFRIRAINNVGPGDWSMDSDWVRTQPNLFYEYSLEEDFVPSG